MVCSTCRTGAVHGTGREYCMIAPIVKEDIVKELAQVDRCTKSHVCYFLKRELYTLTFCTYGNHASERNQKQVQRFTWTEVDYVASAEQPVTLEGPGVEYDSQRRVYEIRSR